MRAFQKRVAALFATAFAVAWAFGHAAPAAEPADALPTTRPRLILSAGELPRRIEWAKPGGPLNPYLESLKDTVRNDRSWAAWERTSAALIYLLTGEEEFAEKAWKPHSSENSPIERNVGDMILYDWLIAADDHWKKSAFPEAERKKLAEAIAKELRNFDVPGGYANPWTPTSHTRNLAVGLAAGRVLAGVEGYDEKARAAFNSHARHAFEKYIPAWNVSGGFMPCGVSYGDEMTDLHTWAAAMLDGVSVDGKSVWEASRYESERLLKKISEDIPHTGVAEGLGGLAEPYSDVNSYWWCDRWSVGILARAYKDPLGQWYLRNAYPKYEKAGMRAFLPLLFVDPDVKPVGPKEAALPVAYYTPYQKPWGKNPKAEGDGRVIMRSHWGDGDQTYLYFRCGDFFDGHQDVGNLHFSLYRKGYFAVEAASRHTYDSCNWREIIDFNHTSLPRNTIRIMDTDYPHGPWGQLMQFFEGTQNHYCFRAYREGGHVEAFETNPQYTYVLADATPMYRQFHDGNPKRDRAAEVRRQLLYVRSDPSGSDDVVIVFDRVDETAENFALKSPLKPGGASKIWALNVATTPRRGGEALKPGIRAFETEGAADTYTLPAGGLWPGEELDSAQCHVQALLPKHRTVRWVGGIDPEYDVPSANLAPGLYYVRLTCASGDELKKHPDFLGGPTSDRWNFQGNVSGRFDTQIPFLDPNIGRYRCGFWLWPARETKKLQPGEFMLWQARVTREKLTILLNGQPHAEYPFDKFATVGAIEKEMEASLRTPGNPDERWRAVLIRGYEWWVDNWREPTLGRPDLGEAEKQGFKFDEPDKVGWPIPGGALDGRMHEVGGIYEKAYPLLKNYPKIYNGKPRSGYSQRELKQICGLWRMETTARGEDQRPQEHFLHVLSPVDKGVQPPESSVSETDKAVTLTVKTAKGRTITATFNKLGSEPGGRVKVSGGKGAVDRDLAAGIDLTGAQPGK